MDQTQPQTQTSNILAHTEFFPISPQSSQYITSPSSSCDIENVNNDFSAVFRDTNLNSNLLVDEYDDSYCKSPIFLAKILERFPDLPSFIIHSEFPTFSCLWLNFQKHIMLAKYPRNRYAIQTWLDLSVAQINKIMASIAKSHLHFNSDLEIVSRSMFSAFRRLKDHMELVNKVFQIIENGRVWFNQSPLQTIAPLVDSLVKQRKNSEQLGILSTFYIDPIHTQKDISDAIVCEKQFSSELFSHFIHPQAPLTSYALKTPFINQIPYTHNDINSSTQTWPIECPCNNVVDNSAEASFEQELEFKKHITDVEDDYDEYVDSDKETTEYVYSRNSKKRSSNRYSPRRTATSYDEETTHYLKSIFYDIYSVRNRLTKEQRKRIEKETGLKPRNITYWFSNHKRRFQNSLKQFKQVVGESNGKVKTYDDFLNWQKSHST